MSLVFLNTCGQKEQVKDKLKHTDTKESSADQGAWLLLFLEELSYRNMDEIKNKTSVS